MDSVDDARPSLGILDNNEMFKMKTPWGLCLDDDNSTFE